MGPNTLKSSVDTGLANFRYSSKYILFASCFPYIGRDFLVPKTGFLTSMVPEPSRSNDSNTSRALARRRFSGDAPRIRILARTVAAFVRLVSWASSAFPASVCERTRSTSFPFF